MRRRWTNADLKAIAGKRGARLAARRPGKYRNEAVDYDGHTFPSIKEKERYVILKAMQNGGAIKDLELQRPYALTVNNILVCEYVADFVYRELIDGSWVEVVEDSKGFRTTEYRLKKKLMRACLGIVIRES